MYGVKSSFYGDVNEVSSVRTRVILNVEDGAGVSRHHGGGAGAQRGQEHGGHGQGERQGGAGHGGRGGAG